MKPQFSQDGFLDRAVRAARRGAATALAVSVVSAAAGDASAAQQARVFPVVHDATGSPVTDLSAADFVVRIDGEDQEVLSAEPAGEPPSIVLLTDQLGLVDEYPTTALREG